MTCVHLNIVGLFVVSIWKSKQQDLDSAVEMRFSWFVTESWC